MGYIKHHAIVATGWDTKRIMPSYGLALSIFGDSVSELVQSPVNGYVSFFIAPDGSKEGWVDSDNGDKNRETFMRMAKELEDYVDIVEIFYGGDESDVCGISDTKP